MDFLDEKKNVVIVVILVLVVLYFLNKKSECSSEATVEKFSDYESWKNDARYCGAYAWNFNACKSHHGFAKKCKNTCAHVAKFCKPYKNRPTTKQHDVCKNQLGAYVDEWKGKGWCDSGNRRTTVPFCKK